jgi:anti-sigma factor RsiW
VRCSSCEALLDQYIDASLEAARAAAVATHLHGCAACEELHRRLRVVDGLLATVRGAELAPDFTFELMDRLRAMPLPAAPKRTLLPLAVFYLVSAWILAGAALALAWPGTPFALRSLAQAASGPLAALQHATHAILPLEPIALSLVMSVLSIDVLLLAAVVVFYRSVRPRLAAYLAAEVR